MCLWLMKILGTVCWLVNSARASWIAAPSSTRSSSIAKYEAPILSSNALLALQYEQYDLENMTTPLSLIIFCALVFAAAIMTGDGVAAKEPKNRANSDEMVGNEMCYVDRVILFPPSPAII